MCPAPWKANPHYLKIERTLLVKGACGMLNIQTLRWFRKIRHNKTDNTGAKTTALSTSLLRTRVPTGPMECNSGRPGLQEPLPKGTRNKYNLKSFCFSKTHSYDCISQIISFILLNVDSKTWLKGTKKNTSSSMGQ